MAYHIKETKTTPLIHIDKGEITIRGRSIPEDSFEFYEPVIDACKKYVENPPNHSDINIHLDYVNSGSKKFLTNILTVFENSYLNGNDYVINWYHDEDDEAMLDLGKDLKSIIKIPIHISIADD